MTGVYFIEVSDQQVPTHSCLAYRGDYIPYKCLVYRCTSCGPFHLTQVSTLQRCPTDRCMPILIGVWLRGHYIPYKYLHYRCGHFPGVHIFWRISPVRCLPYRGVQLTGACLLIGVWLTETSTLQRCLLIPTGVWLASVH